MKSIFIVPGYGVPPNIAEDMNYQLYLTGVFNAIYDASIHGIEQPQILFSGGPTDMRPGSRRTEAGEMMKVFRWLMKRPTVRRLTTHWKLLAETQALSSVENLLNARTMLSKQQSYQLTIFCEHTRITRLCRIAKRIFPKAKTLKIIGIDFDSSSNRYRDPQFLADKEQRVLAFDLWALKSPKNLAQHHVYFQKKFVWLRKAGPKNHVAALHAWWKEGERLMRTLPLSE